MFADLGIAPMNPAEDRVMICGSVAMLRDAKKIVEGLGVVEGYNANPGDFVIEKTFAQSPLHSSPTASPPHGPRPGPRYREKTGGTKQRHTPGGRRIRDN